MHHVTSDYCSAIQGCAEAPAGLGLLGRLGWLCTGRIWIGCPYQQPALGLACKLFQRKHQLTPPTQQPYHHPLFSLWLSYIVLFIGMWNFEGMLKKSPRRSLEVAKNLGIKGQYNPHFYFFQSFFSERPFT